MIVVGVDPHKRSHTAAAIELPSGLVRGERTVAANTDGHQELLAWAEGTAEERLWAVEDCRHVSGSLERFLLAAGEQVVRVPPKLMAGARRGGRRRGKSDAIDALAVARVALREPALPPARPAEATRELKLLVDHRDALVSERSRLQCRLRWLLHELELGLEVPARALDRRLWLDRLARRLRRLEPSVQARLARSLLRRCRSLSAEVEELDRELVARVRAQAPALLELPGCGPLTAAKLLAEIAGVERFAGEAALAMHAGVAPLDASSGQQRRHRLNRSGNRQLNLALHRIALTQARLHEPARAYLDRKRSEGKSAREALRCLKRHLVRVIFKLLSQAASSRPTEARILDGLT
jgi:transposase